MKYVLLVVFSLGLLFFFAYSVYSLVIKIKQIKNAKRNKDLPTENTSENVPK